MTQEAFIKVLDREGYSYKIEGDKIIVTREGTVNLDTLTSLPLGVEFRNKGSVYLNALTYLPPGVVFKNGLEVYLAALTSIPPDVEFKNGGLVRLDSLVGGYFHKCKGNIKGIDSKRLLNVMIKRGMFI